MTNAGNSVDDDECANNCIPTRCGNGQLTNGELCDDGNLVSGDGCDSNCTPTACGNGVVTSGEQCDDGNLHDGDGCDSNCTSTACGNGIQTDGEDCDDGGMTASCNDDCTFSSCGDGRLNVQSGEECDDANNTDDDACDGFCSRMSVIKGAPGHVCWLRADNSMRCWGNNIDGQLGDGTTVSSGTPVAVSVADGAIGLASFGLFTGSLGDEYKGTTCALRSEGKVACWGNGEYGQLGNGSMVNSINPVYAAGLTGTVAVAAGGLRACALRFDGTVRCWGFGIGPTPLDVAGLTGVIQLAVGAQHACAVLKGGGVQCWGRNVEGQLGNGTESPSTTPVTVIGITGAISTSVGFDHSCAVMSSGEVWCWGANWEGQLGDGTTTNRSQAQPVASLSDAFSVSAGYNSTCALTGSGTAFCWGTDHSGSLGNDSQQMAQSSPVPVLGIIDATNITTSGDQSYFGSINGYSAAYGCALTSDGSAKCWGENGSFQLGDGTQNDSFTPVTVLGNPLNFANGIPPSFP